MCGVVYLSSPDLRRVLRDLLVVSVLATLLLYRMIARGNLVNVTSLFYLVPAVTAIMDYLFFGNKLAALSVLGMAMIIVGLMFVFRKTR